MSRKDFGKGHERLGRIMGLDNKFAEFEVVYISYIHGTYTQFCDIFCDFADIGELRRYERGGMRNSIVG